MSSAGWLAGFVDIEESTVHTRLMIISVLYTLKFLPSLFFLVEPNRTKPNQKNFVKVIKKQNAKKNITMISALPIFHVHVSDISPFPLLHSFRSADQSALVSNFIHTLCCSHRVKQCSGIFPKTTNFLTMPDQATSLLLFKRFTMFGRNL